MKETINETNSLTDNTNVSDNVIVNDIISSSYQKISAPLSAKIAASTATEKIPVIIMLTDQYVKFNTDSERAQIDNQQKNLISLLNNAKSDGKASDVKTLYIINGVAVSITPDIIASIAKLPEVCIIQNDNAISMSEPKSKSPNNKVELRSTISQGSLSFPSAGRIDDSAHNNRRSWGGFPLWNITWGVDKINAPLVWEQGINGKEVTVAVLSSGVRDYDNPDLRIPGTPFSKVIGWHDFIFDQTTQADDIGAGTFMCGIIAGKSQTRDKNIGVAPDARLIVAKVTNSLGNTQDSAIINAFQWAVNNRARIICLGYRSDDNGNSEHNNAFTRAINNIVAAGVIPVVGAFRDKVGSSTIGCPADEPLALTVGATDISDNIPSGSPYIGPINLFGIQYIKPDITAPGVNVESIAPNMHYPYRPCGYKTWSGAQYAAAYVAGTLALMLQQNPAMTIDEIKTAIKQSAYFKPGGPRPDHNYGYGRIDAFDAVFYEKPPIADFTCNVTSGSFPLTVELTDTSKYPKYRDWDLGDGNHFIAPSGTHTYNKPGSYTVKLTVSNKYGESSKEVIINVNKKTPLIAWDRPADITYGTPLSAEQYDVEAHDPILGTIL